MRSEKERSLLWISCHVLVRLELAAVFFSDRLWIIENSFMNIETLKA